METDSAPNEERQTLTRRDWLKVTTVAAVTAGAVAGSVPFIQSLTPNRDELPAGTEVDLSTIPLGEHRLIVCNSCEGLPDANRNVGVPVVVLHRTPEMIESAQSSTTKIDPEPDSRRVKRPEWLVVIPVCTHLGCITKWSPEDNRAWHCPCHGAEFDFSGRATKAPAPKNFKIPPHEFIGDDQLLIGYTVNDFTTYPFRFQT